MLQLTIWMFHELIVQMLWKLSNETDRDTYHSLGLEVWEGPQESHGTGGYIVSHDFTRKHPLLTLRSP